MPLLFPHPMFNRKRFLTTSLLSATTLLSATGSVNAQGWLGDRKFSEGIGYRVGDFELHPGVGAEAGVDSNWFQRSSGTGFVNSAPNAPVVAGGMLRITPSLYLSTLSGQRKEGDVAAAPPKLLLRGGLSATYRAFLGSTEIADQNGLNSLSGDMSIHADINPQRPVTVGLHGSYTRIVSPNSLANPDVSFNRNDLGAGLDVTLTPNSGTLSWKLGYGLRASFLDNSSSAPFNNISNNLSTRGEWRFRPKTALFYEAGTSFLTFTQRSLAFNQLNNATPFRTKLGLSGLVTSRFAFLASAGWGASFVDTSSNASVQQYDSVIGQAEAKFFLTANPGADPTNAVGLSISALALGFTRDFQTSYLTSYYGSDRGYAKLSYFFAGRALVSLEGGVGAIEYPKVFYNGGIAPVNPFTDIRADASLFGEYRFTNSLALNTTLKVITESGSQQLPVVGAGGTVGGLYDLSYLRFEGFLGVRWFM